jgi:hypothetical protein
MSTTELLPGRHFARIECNEAPAGGVFFLMAFLLPLLGLLPLWIFGVPLRFNVPAREFNPLVLLPVVATLAGLFFLVAAIVMTLRLRRFGVSTLTLDKRPRVGGQIVGRVASTVDLVPRGDWQLAVRCLEKIKAAGSKGQVYETDVTRWEHEATIPAAAHRLAAGIPVDIAVPDDCLVLTDPLEIARKKRGTLRWVLVLRAQCDGLDYLASFLVPMRSERDAR